MTSTSAPEVAAFLIPERRERFAFTSRPYGLVLLGVLGVVLVMDLLTVAYSIWTGSGAATRNPATSETIAVWLGGAVLKSAIPVYGIIGLQDIFKQMSEKLQPDLELWSRLVPGVYAAGIVSIFADIGVPQVAAGAPAVHRALAARVGEPPVEPPAPGESDVKAGVDATSNGEPPGEPKKRGRFKWLVIGLVVALLVACAVFSVVTFGPLFRQMFETTAEMNLYDENFDKLYDALSERWDPDNSIPNAGVSFSFYQVGDQETEVWLIIELETTESCAGGAANPCEQLADEFAAIALENYPRIDEMAGMQVSVTRTAGAGPITFETGVDKAYSIERWRQELDNSR